MWSWATLASLLLLLSSARSGDEDYDPDVGDDGDDGQTEFLLPYSETEDVDFSLARPAAAQGGQGCWQW